MSRSLRAALLGAALAAIIVAAIAYASRERGEAQSPEKPPLLMLTSLPLMFGDGFDLADVGSPALQALQAHYRILPISVASRSELAKGRLLLMAHPRAQTPENLVALDDWVRTGGHVLLLADPMLEWPSERPLGDPLRPAPMFADTGLLAHWGLRLDAPEQPGPRELKLGRFLVVANSHGTLAGDCAIEPGGLVARCVVGRGKATIIADADLMDVDHLRGAEENLDAILAELDSLGSQS